MATNQVGGVSVHVLDFGPGIGGVGVHLLEINRAIGGVSVHILVPAYTAGPTGGARTFPLPNAKTVWQSQSGKRTFPLPGEQTV